MFIGLAASIVSNMVVHWRSRTAIDDTLDVFPCHGVGGIVGMLLTGVFASTVVNGAITDGWWYGNFELFRNQVLGMLLVVSYSFSVSWLIFKGINLLYPLRVSADEEEIGLDITQHDEIYLEGQLLNGKKEVVSEVKGPLRETDDTATGDLVEEKQLV